MAAAEQVEHRKNYTIVNFPFIILNLPVGFG